MSGLLCLPRGLCSGVENDSVWGLSTGAVCVVLVGGFPRSQAHSACQESTGLGRHCAVPTLPKKAEAW